MLDKIKALGNKIYIGIGVLLGALLLLLKFQSFKRKEVEAKLELADTEKKDAVLEYKESELKVGISEAESKLKALDQKETTPTKDLTASEIESFWNKKKPS